nr:hypothetical protein GCM10025730_40580 [Promicromonospora thailandica]
MIASLLVLAPLPWCRTRPFASAVAVFVASMVQLWVLDVDLVAADLLVLVSIYCITVYGTRRAYLTCAALGVVGAVAFGLAVNLSVHSVVVVIPTLALLAASFAFGLVRRSRRAMLLAMRDRTLRLEIERDQQAQIATAAERSRIAREMHDIVAHSLSVIIAQADGGRYAATADPAAAQRSLGTIAETGRAALADMRRLLGVLRDDQPAPTTPLGLVAPDDVPRAPAGTRPRGAGSGAAGSGAAHVGVVAAGTPPDAADHGAPPGGGTTPASGAAPLRPQPDAADIGQLVEQARDSGMRVSWARVGVERRLPPGVGLTLYRVCQEALTNVRKHAGPRPAVTVLVRWGEEEVELRVEDDGRGLAADGSPSPDEPAPAPGYGLLGMRERAEMFGGTLTAGPRRGGGFSVRFVVPIPRAAARVPAVTEPVAVDAEQAAVDAGQPAADADADAAAAQPAAVEAEPPADAPRPEEDGPAPAAADRSGAPGPASAERTEHTELTEHTEHDEEHPDRTDLHDTRGAR